MRRTKKRTRANSVASDDDEDTAQYSVHRLRDSIFFYDDVSTESIGRLFRELENTRREQSAVSDATPRATVRILSGGGDAYAGLAALDYLDGLRDRMHVTTVADGLCASAATFLLLGGAERICGRHAHVLVHQIRMTGLGWIKYEEARDEMAGAEKLMDRVRTLYEERCVIPAVRMQELMTREVVLDANEVLEYKIATKVASAPTTVRITSETDRTDVVISRRRRACRH